MATLEREYHATSTFYIIMSINRIIEILSIKYYIHFVLIFIFSLLSVNYLSPAYLHADVIMNSIMSIQNVTLFYWEQNRLLSVFPFLLSIIRNPTYNLTLYLIVSSFIFYYLLWKISKYIISIQDNNTNTDVCERYIVFLLFISIFILIFKIDTLFVVMIGQIEYTSSYLLLLLGVDKYIKLNRFTIRAYVQIFIYYFIATGINNSIIIPTVAFFVLCVVIRKEFKHSTANIILGGISFIIWACISNKYGYLRLYSGFDLVDISNNIENSMINILNAINLDVLSILVLFVIAFRLLFYKKELDLECRFKNGLVFFILAWIFVISNNKWIIINEYNVRYFFPVLVSIAFFVTFHMRKYLTIILINKINILIILILFSFIVVRFYRPFVKYDEYEVFSGWANVENLEGNKVHFHAGCYWSVWPVVMFDLMENVESYGLTKRSKGNQKKIIRKIEKQIRLNNQLEVYCHGSTVEECSQQVFEKFENVSFESSLKIKNNIDKMVFQLY